MGTHVLLPEVPRSPRWPGTLPLHLTGPQEVLSVCETRRCQAAFKENECCLPGRCLWLKLGGHDRHAESHTERGLKQCTHLPRPRGTCARGPGAGPADLLASPTGNRRAWEPGDPAPRSRPTWLGLSGAFTDVSGTLKTPFASAHRGDLTALRMRLGGRRDAGDPGHLCAAHQRPLPLLTLTASRSTCS